MDGDVLEEKILEMQRRKIRVYVMKYGAGHRVYAKFIDNLNYTLEIKLLNEKLEEYRKENEKLNEKISIMCKELLKVTNE